VSGGSSIGQWEVLEKKWRGTRAKVVQVVGWGQNLVEGEKEPEPGARKNVTKEVGKRRRGGRGGKAATEKGGTFRGGVQGEKSKLGRRGEDMGGEGGGFREGKKAGSKRN